MYKAPCEWVVPTMPMMSDYEEDLDDCPTFSAENISRPAETLVGAYRAESTDQWTAASGFTTKIPPLFDGSTSCFKNEELIDDWLGLTLLDAGKRGPALKNRLGGDAEMHKGLLNRESLRPEDGIKHFMDTLNPVSSKGGQSVVLWQFYQFTRA